MASPEENSHFIYRFIQLHQKPADLRLHCFQPGHVAWLVVSQNADPEVASLILARSHTFVEIDHEIISMVTHLLPLIQEGLLSVTRESMCMKYWFYHLVKFTQDKSMVMN